MPRQPQRDLGDVGHQHQHDEHDDIERHHLGDDLLHRHLADGAADEDDRADRRMAEADAEIEHHDHAEMYGIDAEIRHHRQQDRRTDQDVRRHVDEAAEHQQQDVDHEEDDVLVARQRQEEAGDLGRHLHQRHHVADRGGEGDQRHHHRHRLHRAVDEERQVAPFVVAIDEHGDDEGIDAGDRAGLDRGEDAAENAAEDDDQGHQTPHRVDDDLDGVAHRHGDAARMVAAIAHDQHEDDQRDGEQQPGHDPGHEQADHRDGAAGRQRIDDGVVARRHEQRLDRGADRHVGGEDAGIADLLHLRDHHRADRRGVGDRGARDAAEEAGGDDVDDREAAAHAHDADQHVGEGDEAPRHAALGHDRAGEHEERDGQHGEFADPVRDLQHDRFVGDVHLPGGEQRGEAEPVGDRHADHEAAEQDGDDDQNVHCPG